MSEEALLKQAYQDAHYAADLIEKAYSPIGQPLEIEAASAAELFRRVRQNLETALGATKELETRALAKRKDKTNGN